MSHFAVAVFTDDNTDVEELLAPYDENITVDRYLLHTPDELVRNARERLEQYYVGRYTEYKKDPIAYLNNHCDGNKENEHYKYISSEFMRLYTGADEQLLERELSDYSDDMVDENKNVYSTYNPNSKWDWYSIGGRFYSMLFDAVSGEYVDEALARDIDFIQMQHDAMSSLEPYDEAINNGWFKPEYLKRKYPDTETYEKIETTFWTRAVVTPDGEWHEVGEMGWFACSSEEPEEIIKWVNAYYDSFIAPAIQNDWRIHIVDCHI